MGAMGSYSCNICRWIQCYIFLLFFCIEYIWLITNIDMFINETFLFLIFKPNQEFLYEIICKKKSRKVTETIKIEMNHHIAVATPTSAWSSKENMPFPDVKSKSCAIETLHLSSDNETHE
eukprot:217054_1